ncbi:MAG: hypothetical protein ACREEP_13405 [Dongiaceae bacterium]
MKPAPHDFDVITDAPRIEERPQRRPPQQAEKAPQPDAERERKGAAPPKRVAREGLAAE